MTSAARQSDLDAAGGQRLVAERLRGTGNHGLLFEQFFDILDDDDTRRVVLHGGVHSAVERLFLLLGHNAPDALIARTRWLLPDLLGVNDVLAAAGKVLRPLLIVHSVLVQLKLQFGKLLTERILQLIVNDLVVGVLNCTAHLETVVYSAKG